MLPEGDGLVQREGDRFIGWSNSANGSVMWAPGDTVTAQYGLAIYAVWEKLSYTIHFNTLGGTTVNDKRGLGWNDSNLVADVIAPTRTGFTFGGWYVANPNADDADPTMQPVGASDTYKMLAALLGLDSTTALDSGIMLYAKWIENSIEIQYIAAIMNERGEFKESTGGDVTVRRENINIITPLTAVGSEASAKDGYHFVGWYSASGQLLSTDAFFAPTKGDYATTGEYWGDPNHATYYAVFEANSYLIQFDPNGGIGRMEAVSVKLNETANLPLVEGQIARVGYEFDGWNTAADGTGHYYRDGEQIYNLVGPGVTEITLFAVWKGLPFKLTLNANGGQPNPWTGIAVPPVTYDEAGDVVYNMVAGGSIHLPDTLTFVRPGYKMDGWTTAPAGVDVIAAGTSYVMPGGDVTLYAHWVPITYTLHFLPGAFGVVDAEEMVDITATYGTTTYLPKNLMSREGYEFYHWKATVDGTDYFFDDMAGVLNLTTEDGAVINLTAIWTPLPHTVMFEANGGTFSGIANPQEVKHGKYADFTAFSASRPGYVLAGWTYTMQTDSGIVTGSTSNPASVAILGNTIFTAVWGGPCVVTFIPGKHGTFKPYDKTAGSETMYTTALRRRWQPVSVSRLGGRLWPADRTRRLGVHRLDAHGARPVRQPHWWLHVHRYGCVAERPRWLPRRDRCERVHRGVHRNLVQALRAYLRDQRWRHLGSDLRLRLPAR